MPSPDAIPYIDLPLSDKDPQDIFETGIDTLSNRLPEWEPRESNIEVMLLEAMGVQVGELTFALNRVPSNVTEIMTKLVGIVRDDGNPPMCSVQFNFSGVQGYTIPAGVQVVLNLDNGVDPIVFTNPTEVDVPVGVNFVVVPNFVGDTYTDDANGTPDDTPLDIIDSIVYVDSAQLSGAVYGGRDPEDDTTYFTRAIQRFSRLTSVLVRPSDFVAAALELPAVQRAFAIDNYNPASGNAPGVDAGHMTLAVYGRAAPLSADDKTALGVVINNAKVSMLAVHVVDPTITTINVNIAIKVKSGYDIATVIAQVTQAIQNHYDPQHWGWFSTVKRNRLIGVVNDVDGVSYVDSITLPATDLTLTGVANLTQPGTITVTTV